MQHPTKQDQVIWGPLPPPSVSVKVTPTSVTEDGPNTLTYEFTASPALTAAITVNYRIGGSAKAGSDFTGLPPGATTGTITIPAGSTSPVTLTIVPTADTEIEPNETVILTLQQGAGYAPGTSVATGTILNDDLSVDIDMNNTVAEDDDIALFNERSVNGGFRQTIPARITNNGADGTIQLSVFPAGSVTLSENTVTLLRGATATIIITPTAVSAAVNDVKIRAMKGGVLVGEEDMTVVQVRVPDHVRRANTPAAMADRIPPRVDTPITVEVIPNLGASGQTVTLWVFNQNANNGTVTVNGNHTLDMTNTGPVNLRGGTQTAPGSAGGLQLGVRVRGEDTIRSGGFSVAAIPENWRQTAVRRLADGVVQFDYAWDSDSGVLADLDQVWIGEHVTYSNGGRHVGAGRPWRGNNTDPTILPARAPGGLAVQGVARDTHSSPGGLPIAGPADSYQATQHYGFHDYRTDNRLDDNTLGWQINLDGPIVIERFVENIGTSVSPIWRYRITKSGALNTANLP